MSVFKIEVDSHNIMRIYVDDQQLGLVSEITISADITSFFPRGEISFSDLADPVKIQPYVDLIKKIPWLYIV